MSLFPFNYIIAAVVLCAAWGNFFNHDWEDQILDKKKNKQLQYAPVNKKNG